MTKASAQPSVHRAEGDDMKRLAWGWLVLAVLAGVAVCATDEMPAKIMATMALFTFGVMVGRAHDREGI